ncbi:MAG TPA: hypothetical protein VNZ56_05710 [Verrucomicrobiae bacterium]|jgi:hypothetical protein|nr:hypothetical protein [Verrucomicrobiae bacterium]
MRGRRALRFLKVFAIAVVALTAVGFVASHLWNYLMPGLFGLHAITFWQAVGLIILGRLLFGGFGPRFGGGPWRRHMAERWEQMTPEERERFREGMRGRCGGSRAAAGTPTPSPAPNQQ